MYRRFSLYQAVLSESSSEKGPRNLNLIKSLDRRAHFFGAKKKGTTFTYEICEHVFARLQRIGIWVSFSGFDVIKSRKWKPELLK